MTGRNVFFAFLGTGQYVSVHYELDGRRSAAPEKFVQAALLELLGLSEVCVRIGTTPEVESGAHWPELRGQLAAKGYDVESIAIATAAREGELWSQFERLGEVFEPGDTVYFDLTHGFRSLSAMALLSIAYFQRVRGFQIGGVYYGAFEALLNVPLDEGDPTVCKNASELRSWQQERGRHLTAPVFDLTAMFALPAWAEGYSTWERTGRADALVELTRPYLEALGRRLQGARPAELCNLPSKLQLVSDAVTLVHHAQIGVRATEALRILEVARGQSKEHPSLKPLGEILSRLAEDLAPLAAGSEGLRRQLAIARWLRKHSRLAESLAIVRELAATCAVAIAKEADVKEVVVRGRDGQEERRPAEHKDFREKIDGWTMFLSGYQPGEPSDHLRPEYAALRAWLTARPTLRDRHRDALAAIHEARNKTAHAFTGEHARDRVGPLLLAERWEKVDRAIAALEALVDALHSSSPAEARAPVFLNLSNHPVATWPAAQRDTVEGLGLGAPVDLPEAMPAVDAEADTDDVVRLAEALADRALALGARGAFVAGDCSLTVALVRALQARGVRCFAATSAREVTESLADGARVKTAVYRFVRWREYP